MGSSQKRIILRFVSIESRTLSCAVADPREWPGGRPPLFLGQTEVQRTAESFFGDRPPPPPNPLISTSGSGFQNPGRFCLAAESRMRKPGLSNP